MRKATLAILLVLAAAALYEAAVALEWIPVGTQPGEGARFEGVVMVSAVVAMFAGIVVSLVLGARGRPSLAGSLFAVAAAALMVAHYFTFDTYYLPTLTRYSDSGSFSTTWVYSVAVAGVLASLLSLARPRIGFLATPVVILLSLFTIVFAGFGH